MFVKRFVETDLISRTMNVTMETITAGMDVLNYVELNQDGIVLEEEGLDHLLAQFSLLTFVWSFAEMEETLECMNVMMGTTKMETDVMKTVELNGAGNATMEVQFKKTPVLKNVEMDLISFNILVMTVMC